jgi:1-acyl-sn-glycerol-3-phosphate acyltransferase
MKKLWLRSVRAYIKLGLFFYFKKIQIHNRGNVPKDQPVLLLSNHQNALLDALLIATNCGRYVHFLTRASVFKKSIVGKLLRSLQMLPVYRIRDGWNNLSKNNPVFSTCSQLLQKGEGVVIFPEGSHNLKRTVRPLSKGFTRIIFETLEKYPDTNLQLIPVGVNFVNAKEFEDSVSVYYGKPICAKDFVTDFSNENVIKLKEVIHDKISQLTTHIPSDSYEETLTGLQELNANFLDPVTVNSCINSDLKNCQPIEPKHLDRFIPFLRFLLKMLLIGPYLVWRVNIKPKIDEVEFISTFRFAVAITLVPVWIILVVVLFWVLLGWEIALLFAGLTLLVELWLIKT